MIKTRPMPPLDRLRQLYAYDAETGEFTHLKNWPKAKVGSRAGTLNRDGYTIIWVGGVPYRAARLAWYMKTEEDPGELEIDHENRVNSDDRFKNLRKATRSEQRANSRQQTRSQSGYRGVSRKNWGWFACIYVEGVRYPLGTHETPELAAAAYAEAEKRLRGKFRSYD